AVLLRLGVGALRHTEVGAVMTGRLPVETMKIRMRSRALGRALLGVALLAVLPALLIACGDDDDSEAAELQSVTIGLTFVPNIQFAPFYVADSLGYYEEAGLEVEFNHHAVGADQFGPLVAGQAARVVPEASDIQPVAALTGKSVGVPGEYGATWIGLLALLDAAGLTTDDIDVQSIGFTQTSALLAGHVDAVMGYINNEPIQLEMAGMPVRTFPVAEAVPLVGNGLVVTEEFLEEEPDTVRALVDATLRGVEYTLNNPEEAVEIAKDYVPTLTDDAQLQSALDVLTATLPLWEAGSGETLGLSEIADWEAMQALLSDHGLIEKQVDLNALVKMGYLPE